MGEHIRNSKSWNDIFLWNKIDSLDYCKQNQLIYQEVEKEQYATLDDCVAHAIAKGNHTAFVHFFMEKAEKRKELFLKVLWNYINEYEVKVKKNKKLPNWGKFRILSSIYWRSFDFDYIELNVENCSYTSGMLSNWRNSQNKLIPDRDAIVQCCFYFGKNVEETNQLLVAAGQEQLYILDIVDAVVMYYLNKYCGNFEIEALEKLKEVKEKINVSLKKSFTEREDMVGVRGFKRIKLSQNELTEEEREVLQILEPRWNKDKVSFGKEKYQIAEEIKQKYGIEYHKTYAREEWKSYQNIDIKMSHLSEQHKDFGKYLQWSDKTEELYRFEKKKILEFGAKSAIGWNIDAEIEKYRRILEQEKENKRNIGDTKYLTVLYRDKFLEENTDIDMFMESGKIGTHKEWVFAQKRYGYFIKTLEYLQGYDYYIKNLQYSPCKISLGAYPVSIEELKRRGKFLDLFSAKFVKNIEEKKEYSKETLLNIVNSIWKIWDATTENGYAGEEGVEVKKSGQFKVKNLIEGRNILTGKGYQVDTEQENKEAIKEAYVEDLTDKIYLMKFAIATGREDEVGTYLQCAGFWDRDLCMVNKVETKNLADRTDCLFLYALKYRDALLEQWAEKLKVDKAEYKNEARKEFPFIKLLMTINRDIQFVNEKILKKPIAGLEKELIYPVNWKE